MFSSQKNEKVLSYNHGLITKYIISPMHNPQKARCSSDKAVFTSFNKRLRRFEMAGKRHPARARQRHDDPWCFNRARQRGLETSLDRGQLSDEGRMQWMERWAERWLQSFPKSLSPSRRTSLSGRDESDESRGAE